MNTTSTPGCQPGATNTRRSATPAANMPATRTATASARSMSIRSRCAVVAQKQEYEPWPNGYDIHRDAGSRARPAYLDLEMGCDPERGGGPSPAGKRPKGTKPS